MKNFSILIVRYYHHQYIQYFRKENPHEHPHSTKEITNLRIQLAETNKQCGNIKFEENSFENTSLEERLVQK